MERPDLDTLACVNPECQLFYQSGLDSPKSPWLTSGVLGSVAADRTSPCSRG